MGHDTQKLERRGFTVAVSISNVKDFDILAINW